MLATRRASTGGTTFANELELRDLYLAISLLNQRGTPTRLVRTGLTIPGFLASLGFDPKPFVTDLGFVDTILKVREGRILPARRRAPEKSIPPELDELCIQATQIDREQRMQTARELGDRVQQYLDGDRDLSPRHHADRNPRRRLPRPARSRPAAALVSASLSN